MFRPNNYLFEQPDFSEDFKPAIYQLPTTTHNSPGSLKSNSLTFEDSPFDCSFDEGSQTGHAQAIWDASINYLQSAIKQFVDSAKGLNDQSLYNFAHHDEILTEQSVDQMIMANGNFKIQQKHQFIEALQKESQLMSLMKELSNLFNENVFHEITYVIFKIWEKKAENTQKISKPSQNEDFILPTFDCFWGYENEQIPKISYSPFFEQKTYDQVVREADSCSEEMAEEIYFDKKLKFLNLRECKKESEDEFQASSLFSEFFKILAKSVFLSSEGFFNQPSEEKNMIEEFNEDFDFDFEVNTVSALQELQQNKNQFVRSFGQFFEDDEEDFEFASTASKKRKLQ